VRLKSKIQNLPGTANITLDVEDLAKDMGISVSVLEETHEIHYQAGKEKQKDPYGGPYPAYPPGKSWDEPSGKTRSVAILAQDSLALAIKPTFWRPLRSSHFLRHLQKSENNGNGKCCANPRRRWQIGRR